MSGRAAEVEEKKEHEARATFLFSFHRLIFLLSLFCLHFSYRVNRSRYRHTKTSV